LKNRASSGERSYAYAKACGIIGKSFIGQRMNRLNNVNRLTELDKMIFPGSSKDLPEKELIVDLEDRIVERAVDSIITIISCFSKPPDFFTLLLRSYEYMDIKSVIFSLQMKEKEAPPHLDLGEFQTVHFDAWPDLKAMVKGTEFSFLLDMENLLDGHEDLSLQSTLDRQYYKALWKALMALPKNERTITSKILSDEISLKDSCLVLRLRTFYGMNADEIKNHLIYVPGRDKKHTSADEAIQCMDFPLDDFYAWSSWRWSRFLNPLTEPGKWKADPLFFQNKASLYLYEIAKRHFHLHPFSFDSIFCFIKLKQFEEDILTSSVEGLNMSMNSKDVFSMLGVHT